MDDSRPHHPGSPVTTVALEVVVVGLAAFRLWRLAGADTISVRLRERFGAGLVDFLECPWCSGTWVAFGLTAAAWWLGWVAGPPVLVGLAAAAVVGLVGDR